MTNKEAKEKLYMEWQKFLEDNIDYAEISEAYKTAFKALEQEPCGDVISREAVEDKLLRLCNELEGIFSDIREKNVDDSVCGLCEYDCDHGLDGFANECPGFETDECFKLADEIRHEWQSTKDLPSVQPKQRTGRWMPTKEVSVPDIRICSNCNYHSISMHKYCPNCGAKMFEPQESEEP